MAKEKTSCVEPVPGPPAPPVASPAPAAREASRPIIFCGKPAPDFEATAFVEGGFKNVKLADYRGRWVVLCFYPGDFTFV